MPRLPALAVSLASIVTCSGCVAVPFALPPSRVQVATGTRSIDRSGPSAGDEHDVPLQVRAGLSPLGLAPELLDRRVDLGVGYLFESGKATRVQGGYLEATGVLGRHWLDDTSLLRGTLGLQLRLLSESDEAQIGRGGAVQLGVEVVSFKAGTFSSTSGHGGSFGIDYGEAGFGLFLEGATAQIGSTAIRSASVGLTIHLPFLAGVAYAWASPEPSSSSTSSSSTPPSGSSPPPSSGPPLTPTPPRR